MNTLEAQRIVAVLDEALMGLRLLSFITPEVVAAADQLAGMLGQDVQDALQQHAAALAQLPDDFQPHELLGTSLALLRVLKHSPGSEDALAGLHTSRSPAVLQLLSYFDRHRAQVLAVLHTSVEEDAANKEHLASLAQRREAAAAEQLQLEHRLKLQRLEQAKQMGALQAAFDAASAELAGLRSSMAARQAADDGAAAAERGAADAAHGAQHARLAQQLEAAQHELAALRSDARDASGAAAKARRRAQQDCEAAIGEYDAELCARQAEHDAALAAHNELLASCQRASTEAAVLRAERVAHEDAARAAAEARWRAEMAHLRREAAAYAVQNAWKCWRKRRAAAAKASAKKGGKGGPKSGGKKK